MMSNVQQNKEAAHKIDVISECYVKPKREVEVSKERIYLKALDICMLHIHPIQKGLLFTFNSDNQPTPELRFGFFEKLKESLSIVLVHFYPLAGRFATEVFRDEGACAVFIDCNKFEGARLIHATAKEVSVSDIITSTHVPISVRKFFDLGDQFVNFDCHTRALLSVQVTDLIDGVFLGFSISHSVVDGTSFSHFVNSLSEVFQFNSTCLESSSSFEISRVPVFEHGPILKLPYLGLDKIMTRRGEISPLRDRIFHFSSNSLATLKAKVNEQCTTHNISSFKALASLVWRSITKARNLSTDEQTSCSLAISARTRLDPPVSNDYFGNYLTQVIVACKVGELLSHDLGWATVRLNDVVKAQDNTSIRGSWKRVTDQITTVGFRSPGNDIFGSNNVAIGGSAWFNMYGPEFGLGKAVAVRMGFGNKSDGKITVNPAREGGGSVDLEISFTAENMAALEADHEFMSFVSFN